MKCIMRERETSGKKIARSKANAGGSGNGSGFSDKRVMPEITKKDEETVGTAGNRSARDFVLEWRGGGGGT